MFLIIKNIKNKKTKLLKIYGVILSGGNVDLAALAPHLARNSHGR